MGRWRKRLRKAAKVATGQAILGPVGAIAGGISALKKPDGGGGAGPTNESTLEGLQLAALKQQMAEQEMFRPEYYRQLGYKIETDPTTGAERIVKLSEDERMAGMSPDELSSYTLQKLANERSLKAMRGELDIDPALETDIKEQESQARSGLQQQLGADYELSTPGQRRLAELATRANQLRSAMRHGELTASEAVAANRGGDITSRQSQYKEIADPFQALNAGSNMLGYYAKNREIAANLEAAKKMARAQLYSGLAGAGGSLAGMALFA